LKKLEGASEGGLRHATNLLFYIPNGSIDDP
jgi:hypothetical protein